MTLPTRAELAVAPRRTIAWTSNNATGGPGSRQRLTQVNGPWNSGNSSVPFPPTSNPAGESPTSYPFIATGGATVTYTALDQAMALVGLYHAAGDLTVSHRVTICDLLWMSPVFGSSGTQTVDPFTLPARDVNGSTNGEGCLIGVFSGTQQVVTVTYTNSAGTSGRTGATADFSGGLGGSADLPMQAGDTGVRSIQSASGPTGGGYRVVIYRPIARAQTLGKDSSVTGGCPPEAASGKLNILQPVPAGALLFPLYSDAAGLHRVNTIVELAAVA